MDSPFDLNHGGQRIESKIVVALERISEAFRVLLWNESKGNTLSPIQTQILIFLLFHARERCTVSYLAQEFNMTKATISDSIRLLLQKGLVEKQPDRRDTRSFTISLTDQGTQTARHAAGFAGAIEQPLHKLSDLQKEVMLTGMLGLIRDLVEAGVITRQRMCYTCAHFRVEAGEPYCGLLLISLVPHKLRIDCPEHRPAL